MIFPRRPSEQNRFEPYLFSFPHPRVRNLDSAIWSSINDAAPFCFFFKFCLVIFFKGLDMVVRNDNGDVLDISKTSTTRLYEVSLDTTNQIQNASMRNITPLGKNKLLHNVLISVHNFGCEVNEDSEFLFALYDGDGTKPITENFLVKWNQQGFVTYFSKFRVLFTDLSFNDLFRKKVYLVAFVINLNKIGLMDKRDSRAG